MSSSVSCFGLRFRLAIDLLRANVGLIRSEVKNGLMLG